MPGVYELTTGITIPPYVSLRGMSTQTALVQMSNVLADTTLITMNTTSRVEDVGLTLTSSGHHTLIGVNFTGGTTADAQLRNCRLTVDNYAASNVGSSNVYAVRCSGGGTVTEFSYNVVRGCTVNTRSNGGGIKRGVLVSNSNSVTIRDTNIYVYPPREPTTSSGSYVGVETNDTIGPNTGSIQLRTSTIGSVTPVVGDSYSASDILQTTPPTITTPSYLASPGIQLGPGTDLLEKTAGRRGFTPYVYPTTIYYGLRGNLSTGTSGWLWPGTQAVTAGGIFPDATGVVGNVFLQVSETQAASDRVIVTSTVGLAVNMPVVFNTNIGNIVAGTVYYVHTVVNTTRFTISATINGAIFAQSNATVAVVGNAYSTITVTASAVNLANEITLNTVTDIQVGMPIIFSELLGNLVPGTPYYVSFVGLTYVRVSALPGGADFTTGVASVSSPALLHTISTQVSAVSGTTITVNHSDGINIGMAIVFAANIGNIVQGTVYYVRTTGGNGGTTLSISTIPSGPAFAVGTAVASVRANVFSLTAVPAYYRLQQPALLSGLSVSMASPANLSGTAVTVQFAVYRTPANANPLTSISPISDFFMTFNDSTTTSQTYYNSSKTFGSGDLIHVYLSYYGGVPLASDVTVQLDMF
jgi:hypothetical protein